MTAGASVLVLTYYDVGYLSLILSSLVLTGCVSIASNSFLAKSAKGEAHDSHQLARTNLEG